MTQKPYKENKTALREFLERKNLAPMPKEARGKNPSKVPTNKYYLMLKALSKVECPEVQARLAAVGWNEKLTPNATFNKMQYNKVEEMRQTDGEYDPTYFWAALYIGRKPREKGYYVAGKRYNSREEFLLSLTELGKELL